MFNFMNGGAPPGGGPVDTELYDLLGVPADADDNTIKTAYRKLAKEFHPDKNPQYGEKFKEISYAYEILSNPQRRRMYDARGLDGIKEAGSGGHEHGMGGMGGFGGIPEDLLSHLMGGGGAGGMFGRMGGRQRRHKAQDTIHPLKVSLEDLYTGKVSKLQITKDVVCTTCRGSGSSRPPAGGGRSSQTACVGCRGRGIKVTLRQLAPGMMQQMQSVCPDCKGEGAVIADKDRCKKCSGKKTVKQQKVLEVVIAPGMREGQKVTLHGEGDQEPDVEPGDVIIVVTQKPHEVFKRSGSDLVIAKTVNLTEALCGFSFALQHLDGRQLIIDTEPGDVLEPDCTRGVPSLGMPKYRHPNIFGTLYIKFDVQFPEAHFGDERTYGALQRLLPGRPRAAQAQPGEEAEEVSLMPFDGNKYEGKAGGRREAYDAGGDEDDSDEAGGAPHGAQRVQCAHQ